MDQIILKGLRFYGYHGALPQEQELGQQFIVDVTLSLDLQPAGLADELEYTINYATVYTLIKKIVEEINFKLIEALAETIALRLLDNFNIKMVNVQVRKPSAPVPGVFDYVAVDITRQQQKAKE